MIPSLGIIGCGNMGYALLKGIKSSKTQNYAEIFASDINPVRSELFQTEFGAVSTNTEQTVSLADIIILAVKPAQVKQILNLTRKHWQTEKMIISIAAGITTQFIETQVGIEIPVVRVMPNTPCLVAEGVSAISGGKYCTEDHTELVQNMFTKLGTTVIVEENYMDAITAVSGSGPGYAYLVAEAMIDAAVNIGINSELARQLVVNTIRGSMTMLLETGEHPAVLKSNVSSPGGTTIAGLRQLEQNGVRKAFFAAIEKACEKSIELGKH